MNRLLRRRALALLALLACLAAACSSPSDEEEASPDSIDGGGDTSCPEVAVASSPEKLDLLTALARSFNDDPPQGVCANISVERVSSGAGMQALARGWDESSDGPLPAIWTPASSAWGAVLNHRLEAQGLAPLVGEGRPFMLTPLVIAMPQPMAEAIGYPGTPFSWADLLRLSTSSEGWAAFGHPEWGAFRLGKTNPNFSTSGLSALIAQAYAATGKTERLSLEDLARPDVDAFARGVESAVVHYGDTTLTFLNNLARADQGDTALLYASAVAVEEKSVIDYNRGNPDGVLQPGEQPREPRYPLVALYPTEGTLYSDNPLFVLDAEWVSEEQRTVAEAFGDYVLRPENQQRVMEFGFRPANPEVPVADPIVTENGVDPDQPQTLLQVPEPRVMNGLLEDWQTQRKGARVQLVLDVSGSMQESAAPGGAETKLDLAKRAVVSSLDQFSPNDEVGLRVFTTDADGAGLDFLDLVPVGPIAQTREEIRARVEGLLPRNGTPLYLVAGDSFDEASAAYDPARINAVVLLTDGVNDDGDPGDDQQQLESTLDRMRRASQGENARPVRLFTIGYGRDADMVVLRQLAEATSAAAYDASDPRTIETVFANVISNF
ncbi:MAG: VWA domain-containing protein [Acidimicrobiia bacterium]|nr:VWA domain-containing protein [Acidimicrobiia bacterium]